MADVRDSDAVRNEFELERDRLRQQVQDLAAGTSGGGPAFDEGFADSGQVAAEQGEAQALAHSLQDQLDDVEAALTALDEGHYGLCEVCQAPIGAARLEAMPTSRRCIEHA